MCSDRKYPIQIPDFDTLGDFYADNPLMRALVALAGLIPVASVVDAAVVAQWEKAKKERFRILLDKLSQDEEHLTEELIQQEDFIYAFISVARSSILTRQREKIRLFAQLLTNACRRKKLDSDEFEENLKILDELSLRELKLLLLFKKHEDRLSERAQKQTGDHRRSQWDALANDAESELGISREHLSSTLSRLARTGLYEPLQGVTFASNDTLGSGNTTPKFIEFLKWILDEDTNLKSDKKAL
jgi:hypothetical protein